MKKELNYGKAVIISLDLEVMGMRWRTEKLRKETNIDWVKRINLNKYKWSDMYKEVNCGKNLLPVYY